MVFFLKLTCIDIRERLKKIVAYSSASIPGLCDLLKGIKNIGRIGTFRQL